MDMLINASVRELPRGETRTLPWLDSKEAAEYLRKSMGALHKLVARGYVRPRKFRRRLYFLRIELDRLLESSGF
ncbi:MAG: helix-turn-helix domain-containing protein [Oligoflexales bacterium]|nr:helix-turn-helix domain-containing protein [Oligoflexales bacterium]